MSEEVQVNRESVLIAERGPDKPNLSASSRFGNAVRLSTLPIAILLWLISLPQIQLDRMGEFGLVPLLPTTFWLALAVLLVGYAVWLRRINPPEPLLLTYILTLIAILHGTPTLLYGETLRYSWTWKHVGVVDLFMRHFGTGPPIRELDVYQNWPGFFTFNELLAKASGLSTPFGYPAWAPIFNNVLIIGPIFLIFRTFSADRRLIWSAFAIYFLGSWVGQDYFSPQGCAFYLYLTVIAVCLRYLAPKMRSARTEAVTQPMRVELSTRDRWVLVGLCLVPMMAAIVVTHPLTPFMLISGLVLLAVFSRQRVRILALIMIIFTVAWDFLFAWPYIQEHLPSIRTSFGDLGKNTASGFINLASVRADQVFIAKIDRAHSAVVIGLAVIGLCRRFRGRRELSLLLLAIAPLLLIVSNDYGGEAIFRVYLFALFVGAFYAAAAFFPHERSGCTRRTSLALLAVMLLLVPGFAVSYYGKEQVNHFSSAELEASRFMYGIAPKGSILVVAMNDYPSVYANFEFYDYYRFALEPPAGRRAALDDPVVEFHKIMDPERYHHAFLLLTRTQTAQAEMLGIMPPGGIARIEQVLSDSPGFIVIYRNQDAVVITMTPPPSKETS